MADVAEKRMTVAEFLDWDDGTDTRYELIDGRPVAMAPVAPSHSIIVVNLSHELKARLKPPCYAGSGGRCRASGRDDTFYEADIVIRCTPVAPGVAAIPNPVVVIEVLSPSTIEHDRGRKAYDCRRIPTVQEIALMESEQPHIEVWRRRGAKWEVEDLIGDATVELETVGIAVPFAAMYAEPITVMAGVHPGCFEVFGNEHVRGITDLKGKKVRVQAFGSSPHGFLTSIAAYIGLDPATEIDWVTTAPARPMDLFVDGKIDAFLGLPPEPQELRSRKNGHVIVDSAIDRP